jgi:hypothetical protein
MWFQVARWRVWLCFGGTYCLHLHGKNKTRVTERYLCADSRKILRMWVVLYPIGSLVQPCLSSRYHIRPVFPRGLLLKPDCGGNKFFRNSGKFQPDYAASYRFRPTIIKFYAWAPPSLRGVFRNIVFSFNLCLLFFKTATKLL